MKTTITTAGAHGYSAGDRIRFIDRPRWWVRLWRWVTRYKPPVMRITKANKTTFEVEP